MQAQLEQIQAKVRYIYAHNQYINGLQLIAKMNTQKTTYAESEGSQCIWVARRNLVITSLSKLIPGFLTQKMPLLSEI